VEIEVTKSNHIIVTWEGERTAINIATYHDCDGRFDCDGRVPWYVQLWNTIGTVEFGRLSLLEWINQYSPYSQSFVENLKQSDFNSTSTKYLNQIKAHWSTLAEYHPIAADTEPKEQMGPIEPLKPMEPVEPMLISIVFLNRTADFEYTKTQVFIPRWVVTGQLWHQLMSIPDEVLVTNTTLYSLNSDPPGSVVLPTEQRWIVTTVANIGRYLSPEQYLDDATSTSHIAYKMCITVFTELPEERRMASEAVEGAMKGCSIM
jgi:hypothetical protein